MVSSTHFIALAAIAATPILAELAVIAPIASTTCRGGETCRVEWEDNGEAPTLEEQGSCTIALYTGNSQQQTFLQGIEFPEPINVATTTSVEFTVDPGIGENDNHYFIRFTSEDLTQAGSDRPYLSFSAMFRLEGMTGTFNSSVQSQIEGITSAGSPTATRTTAASTTGSATGTTTRSSSSGRPTSTNANNTGAAALGAVPQPVLRSTAVVAFIGAIVSFFY